MDIQNFTDQQRIELIESHPVITKNYLIITPVITSAYALIRERVYMRSTGTFMYATPRMGKTTCARAIHTLLEGEFPNIFVMRFIAEPNRQHSGMLIDILESDKLAHRSNNYKGLQSQLMMHIQSSLVMRNGKQFVLMIDEMQNLSEENLVDLATIHNRLETFGIKMTTIGFGQPEIMSRRTALMATNQSFLIARFLSEPIQFIGCASKEDLEKILSSYDEEQFYPENSTYTFTNFFFPRAYESGLRLSHYTNSIWKALKNASKGLKDDSIPMEHLSRTIEFLLVSGHEIDSDKFRFSSEDITKAVESSNLSYFSGLMNQASAE